MTTVPVKAWICPVCGYIHYGDTPPESCPVCGEDGSVFTPYEEPVKPVKSLIDDTLRTVIIGAGIAGISAAEAIRKLSKTAPVTLISEEPGLPYYRINLTRYLAGEVSGDEMALHNQDWYANETVELLYGKVSSLDIFLQEIALEDGQKLNYDRLILTTGANPFVPPIEGREKKNIKTLRTRADAEHILSTVKPGGNVICIGGGILGLETAAAIARSGVQVTVLEALPWLMPRQLNQKSAAVFERKIGNLGISVRTNVKTKLFTGEESVTGVTLEDGTILPADLVIISAGVRSNITLARESGLKVNQGIIVDDTMRTSYDNIFAAGDVAEHRGILYGTWTPAQLQGSIAGMSALGQSASFPGVPRSNKVKVLGFDLISTGTIEPETPADRMVDTEINESYFNFLLRGNKLIGCIFLGDTTLAGTAKSWIEEEKEHALLSSAGISVEEILKILAG
jgi:nitrite reductase (NADH) large subunit